MLPTGTVAQRPPTLATGQLRFNIDTNQMELFNGTDWTVVGETIPKREPWNKWYAWYPVKVNGKYKWFKEVYRREITVYSDQKNEPPKYEYGTIFDAIKDAG